MATAKPTPADTQEVTQEVPAVVDPFAALKAAAEAANAVLVTVVEPSTPGASACLRVDH